MIIDKPTTSQYASLKLLWKEAFGDSDEFIDLFFKTAFDKNRAFVATEGKDIAAALYYFNCSYNDKPVAYVYAVATAKKYRGKGICKKLMDHLHNHLELLGFAGAVLVPGSESLFDFYAKMGYETVCFVSEFECDAKDKKIPVTKITKDEYAVIRRQYLPDGGIVQTHENLDFSESMYNFYKGDGFVIAARIKDGVLYCIELLGNVRVAPFIVFSLGAKRGKFRTLGNDRAFAMYRSFDNGLYPSYFGLAFD